MGKRAKGDEVWTFSKPDQKVQWPYTKWFRAHIGKRLKYAFVHEHWDRSIAGLEKADRLRAETSDPVAPQLTETDRSVLKRVREAGLETLMGFLDHVDTRESAEAFCETAEISPRDLISLLRKIHRFLPFGAQMRQLVDERDPIYEHVDTLVAHKLGYSLELLERGRTRGGRKQLVEQTGIPMAVLLDLIRRADLTRLHLMSGGMIRTSWVTGYKGLAALKRATAEEFLKKTEAYYDRTSGGKPFDWSPRTANGHINRMREAIDILEE